MLRGQQGIELEFVPQCINISKSNAKLKKSCYTVIEMRKEKKSSLDSFIWSKNRPENLMHILILYNIIVYNYRDSRKIKSWVRERMGGALRQRNCSV